MEYHSPWELHGPLFLQQLVPELPALRRTYEERGCTLLVCLVLREPVSHLVSDFFFASRFLGAHAKKQRAALGLQGGRSDNRSLLEHARKHAELLLFCEAHASPASSESSTVTITVRNQERQR